MTQLEVHNWAVESICRFGRGYTQDWSRCGGLYQRGSWKRKAYRTMGYGGAWVGHWLIRGMRWQTWVKPTFNTVWWGGGLGREFGGFVG
ncbi:hypothetical protein HanIR_Chr03g0109971 [Helianthus annuus]|nr:hypothetical protein HanIR_Chr03g0109971 [Helianthus annuus]